MGAESPPRPSTASVGVAAFLSALVLAAWFAGIGFGLAAAAPVTEFSSGIFDMDVQRVVVDLTSANPGYRTSVHPLQKLLVAPFGIALNRSLFEGANPLAAAKWLCAVVVWVQSLLVGWLAWRWTDRSLAPALAASALTAASFSSVLAASLPESAAFASLGASLPLVLLIARSGRPMLGWEIALWGLLGTVCVGLTITQLVHWGIALGFRVAIFAPNAEATRVWTKWKAPALAVVVLFGLTALGVQLQSWLFPGTPAFYATDPLGGEQAFMRLDALASQPVGHVVRLLAHFAVYDFVAPGPAYSDFLIRDWGFDWWSLSVEAAGLEQWGAARLCVAAAVLAGVAIGFWALSRTRDVRFAAPALCVLSQFALHLAYGREYVLYSPHWHGVWVALLVAVTWNRLAAQRTRLIAGWVLLCGALLISSVAVMQDVYAEVEVGLGTGVRDAFGAPLD
jgi:hypothetical protein